MSIDTKCPACGTPFTYHHNPFDPEVKTPGPGDVSVCLECGKASIFNGDLSARPVTNGDVEKLSIEELLRIAAAMQAVKVVKQRSRGLFGKREEP